MTLIQYPTPSSSGDVSDLSSNGRTLEQVLRAASMPTRTVILTILDKSWASPPASVLDLFLESFQIGERTKHLLNHLIIIALDTHTLHYCQSIRPHCFHFKSTGQRRKELFLQVLQLGYNLVYTDVDVMWLRNPMSLFDGLAEISLGCDAYSRNQSVGSQKATGEFFYIKASEISMEFLKFWKVASVLYPYTQNQSICEMVMGEDIRLFGIRMKFIDKTYIGGLCQPNKDASEIYVMQTNCCEELESKVHDLKIFLDDARKYKALLSNASSLEKFPSLATTPNRCLES
ncbi:uncharacterized protein At4g15970 [Ricinus communis]|nr:uncharacterized protein At4g15970 [Ricinus communis]